MYQGLAAAIIIYDIIKYFNIKELGKRASAAWPTQHCSCHCGKCDVIEVREVMETDAKDYANYIHAVLLWTSTKNKININRLFI